MFKNRSVDLHDFSMVPRADVPRSKFDMQDALKTTFDAGKLVPIYVEEVMPGDALSLKATFLARLATPIKPVMDNLHFETFFFYCPYRILWSNFKKMMGEQNSPADSISFSVPQIVSKAGGYDALTIFDYFGLVCAPQVAGANTYSHSALPLRAYNKIMQDWFRDENLQDTLVINVGDGPDLYTDYALYTRGKRHDYFTSALPWAQKGTAVAMPLGTSAPIKTAAATSADITVQNVAGTALKMNSAGTFVSMSATAGSAGDKLYADLSAATAATINAIRLAFQTQRLLERDARGGTRYTEIVRSHFGVVSPDARLQRPEYLGGGHQLVTMSPVAQTSGTSASGTTTPMATLSGIGQMVAHGHGFRQSFTEHGVVIGLANVRADLTYQQGLRRFWSRSTRYDFYWPAFAMLGEQAILNKELYLDGSANDSVAFGYIPRWDEYRYRPSMITGLFRSTHATPLDIWHYGQEFGSLPTLNSTFIQDGSQAVVSRTTAVGAAADGQQLLLDAFFETRAVRPLPMNSVPGLIDHF